MSRRGWKGLARLATIACATAVAHAQSALYLTPDKYTVEVGRPAAIRAESGVGAAVQRVAWPTERVGWLFVREAGRQTNRDDVGPAQRGGDSISVTPTRPGVTLVAMDVDPQLVTLPGDEIRAFLRRAIPPAKTTTLLEALAGGDGVRVRRIESAKALVRVNAPDGKASGHSAVAQSKTGQAVEIRALSDPTMVVVGSDLPLRAYVAGEKLVGARMLATCLADGVTREAMTDSTGSCHFRIDSCGIWRVEFHDVRPAEGDADADWTLYSATLTFEVTRSGAGK